MAFSCGTHRALIYERGGARLLAELEPLTSVRWQRIRDEISNADVAVPASECCEVVAELEAVRHELHLMRNGESVWEGVITRIEYDFDVVRIYAADMLWPTTRTAITTGYNNASPNRGLALDRMDWLLRDQCFALYNDEWNMVPHLHPIRHRPDMEPTSSRVTNAYQMYVWEDFDNFAENYGTDYTVINRDVYYWDLNHAWKIIRPLDENYLSQFPRIVQYGNQAATRGFVTNGHGYAGIAYNSPAYSTWGWIDHLTVNENDGQLDHVPTPDEIAGWADTAARRIDGKAPPPLALVIPANTTLMPGSMWEMEDLVPGAWFHATVTRLCKSLSEWQRLHEIVVTEEAPTGETVQFTAVSAPSNMVIYP